MSKATGTLDSKLWIVANCPKKSDAGGPLSSGGSSFLREHLRQCGIDIANVRIEYLVPDVPPKNGFFYFTENQPDRVTKYVKILRDKIKECKPNLVLCLGAEPLYYLMGHKDIMKWRGHVIFSSLLECKLMATIDPEYARRQYFVDIKEKPGQYAALMSADVEKAAKECQTHELKHHKFELTVQPDFSVAKMFLERLLDTAKYISYDIETIQPYAACFVDCIGFAGDLDSAICIPFFSPHGNGRLEPYWKSEQERNEIFRYVKWIMESNIPKVAQNAQFDSAILRHHYSIKTNNLYWDTMVAAHCLYCDLPKDLGSLIALYTNLPYHKYLIGTGSLNDRWEYNAADALANLHIMMGEVEEMKEYGILTHYLTVSSPAINTCVAVQLKGVYVEEELRERALVQLDRTVAQIGYCLNKLFKEKLSKDKKKPLNFNPSSPVQKGQVFYDMFQCGGVYKNNKITADKTAMDKFMTDSRKYVAVIAEACLLYKEAAYMSSKLRVATTAGRMHSKFDVTGTDTGRLNSTESELFGTGTNLQNLEKGLQRKMLIPDPGYEFLLCDLYSAEAYLVALMAKEAEMIKMMQSGEKIYTFLLDETNKRYPKEVEAAGFNYKAAKQLIHLMNYGGKPQKMSISSGLPLEICQWQYQWYHNRFPGINQRMLSIETQVTRHKLVKSLIGRHRICFQKKDYKLLNMVYAWPTQSTIGEITIIAMNKCFIITERHLAGDESVPYMMPLLNTHDGLVVMIKKGTREQCKQVLKDAFALPIKVGNYQMIVPIEIGWAENFNDINEPEVCYYGK